MMNKEQYLLIKLAEEAGEVAQRALKAVQFGLDEIQPGQEKTNAARLFDELNDLQAILVMAAEFPGLSYTADPDAVLRKIEKVNNYLSYSISLGRVAID